MRINSVVTPVIIGINVLVFIGIMAAGASFFGPTPEQALEWGACSVVAVLLKSEWWRLITSMFVHFGFLHLFMNMYMLFDIGKRLEPILGKLRFAIAYFVTGIFGGLISLAWHLQDHVVSAGASGAIFGIVGVFFALTTTNLLPSHVKEAYFVRIGLMIAANIGYGLQPGIDMAAHMGGLISGIILGYLSYFVLVENRFQKFFRRWTYPVVALAIVLFSYRSLTKLRETDPIYFHGFVTDLQELESTVRKYQTEFPSNPKEVRVHIQTNILPLWENAALKLDKVKSLQLSQHQQKMRNYSVQWVTLHHRRALLLTKEIQDGVNHHYFEIRQIDAQLERLTP